MMRITNPMKRLFVGAGTRIASGLRGYLGGMVYERSGNWLKSRPYIAILFFENCASNNFYKMSVCCFSGPGIDRKSKDSGTAAVIPLRPGVDGSQVF